MITCEIFFKNASRGRTCFGWLSYRVKCYVKNPSYPDVVECFRECPPILQSWNVSRAGTEGHHRRMMYCESGQEDLPAAIPLAIIEFFGSPTTSVWSLVYPNMCCVCVVRGFCLTTSEIVFYPRGCFL